MESQMKYEGTHDDTNSVPDVGLVPASPRRSYGTTRRDKRETELPSSIEGRKSRYDILMKATIIAREDQISSRQINPITFARNEALRLNSISEVHQQSYGSESPSARSRSPVSVQTRNDSPGLFYRERPRTHTPPRDDIQDSDLDFDRSTASHRGSHSPLGSERGQSEATAACVCPVSTRCPRKGNELHDCRTLVAEWEKWTRGTQYATVPKIVQPQQTTSIPTTRQILQLLDFTEQTARNSRGHTANFKSIGRWIRAMRESSMSDTVLNQTQILPRLQSFLSNNNKDARRSKRFPFELEEELDILTRRWIRGDMSTDPNRGLIPTQAVFSNGTIQRRFKVDKAWPHYKTSNYFGAGDLVNGQRGENRVHLIRDGIHGATMAGIWGVRGGAAQALVMGFHDDKKEEYYADIDQGDQVYYIGTAIRRENGDKLATNLKDQYRDDMDWDNFDAQDLNPTAHTRMLIESVITRQPVRLIRSSKLPSQNPFRPNTGYRYDGLYTVVSQKLLNKVRQIYRFKLERLPDQSPIRRDFGI